MASTQSEMTEIILPNDTNTLGNLLGGRLMHFIDLTGAMAAYRHSRTHVVTAAMDHIDFIRPVQLGDLLTLKSSVNRAFTSSMEVGVKVWAENTQHGRLGACGQRLPGLCGHRRTGAPAEGSSNCSRRRRTRCAATRMRCCAASIARRKARAAKKNGWPPRPVKMRESRLR